MLKFYSFACQILSFQELFVAFDTLENFFAIKDLRKLFAFEDGSSQEVDEGVAGRQKDRTEVLQRCSG